MSHCQYWVCPPAALIIAIHLPRMDLRFVAGYSTHVPEPVQTKAVLECWAVFDDDELVCPIHPKYVQ